MKHKSIIRTENINKDALKLCKDRLKSLHSSDPRDVYLFVHVLPSLYILLENGLITESAIEKIASRARIDINRVKELAQITENTVTVKELREIDVRSILSSKSNTKNRAATVIGTRTIAQSVPPTQKLLPPPIALSSAVDNRSTVSSVSKISKASSKVSRVSSVSSKVSKTSSIKRPRAGSVI